MRKILILSCLLLLNSSALSTTYYIDNYNGNDFNPGTSLSAPWKNISKVNETSFSPGDEILFKRGGVWYETLIISSSGTSEEPIIYSSYGDGDLPAIDASNIRANSIYLHSKNHIIIKQISLKNATGSGALRIMYANGVRAEGNGIYITGHSGIFIENSTNSVISGNYLLSPEGILEAQTDGIYSQRNTGNIYENNNIHLRNSHPSEHIDGIQSFMDTDITIRNNRILQENTKTNSQGIYATSASGNHLYYNNIIDCPNVTSNVIGFYNADQGVNSLKVYHNTVIGKGGNILAIAGSPQVNIKNNIFIALSSNHSVVNIKDPISNAVINNNLYFNNGNPKVFYYLGNEMTVGQWKLLGYDAASVVADPLLHSGYYPYANSPALDKGINLGNDFAYDIEKNLRSDYLVDLGAIENINDDITTGTGINSTKEEEIITYELHQNYPNPFNPATIIKYAIPAESEVSLKVFDITGREVVELFNGLQPAGEYAFSFNGENLSSGIYVYQIKAGTFTYTRKMTLIK